ncbi:ATP19 ATP synthase subunit K [Candida maltosa Xu316]|uniref:ATP synthase subunit K, mitochondrial n=1 Tax=Candida maltosa (strain Xu316) TaxID=1245528 RepID=M3JBG9_CANMX|nr:hypothetical protein G210_5748 [Candida maltosa Xu316]
MGASYQVFGKTVQAYQLSLATLGGAALLVVPKPWGPPKPTSPAINAASPEEEKFVKEWLAKHSETVEKSGH